MAQKIQASFSAGELDPALHERTTFDKYKTGLKTLRNAHIGKTGRIISRAGKKLYLQARDPILTAINFTADTGSDVLIVAANRFRDGDAVTVSSTTTLPSPLVADTTYYVLYTSSLNFRLCTSLANVAAGTYIDITTTGSGTHTVTPVGSGSRKSILYSVPYTDYVIEWGHGYARVHDVTANSYVDVDHTMVEDDLPYVQFVPTKGYVNVFCKDNYAKKLVIGDLDSADPFRDTRIENVLVGLVNFAAVPTESGRVIGGTGEPVQYAIALVKNGEEFTTVELSPASGLPINVGEENEITISSAGNTGITELRVYRRPFRGIAYGYMATVPVAGNSAIFIDYGEDVDYTQQPIKAVDAAYGSTITSVSLGVRGRTGCFYQQKLLVSDSIYEEVIFASRTGYLANFYRDFPFSDESGLVFKCGTSGYARILHLIDSANYLLAFTTVGLFSNSGVLSPSNIRMEKRGNWIIDDKVVPLEIPGGLLFVDKSTNTVRNLIFSEEAGGFPGDEVSIFSDHLFRGRQITSWAFQGGEIPLVWVVFEDGEAAGFTYDKDHQMRAWCRCDTNGLYESVTVRNDLDGRSVVYFVINRDGVRYIEYGTDRFVEDIKEMVCMDSAVSYNSELSAGATLNVTADDPMDWEGTLTLTSNIAIFSNSADLGAVGSIFRMFDSEGAAIDLEVTTYTGTTSVKVTPSVTFPSAEASGITIYRTYSTLTGLSHLNGKLVSLMVDGYVEASPNNDIEDYDDLEVSGGQVTIPDGLRGAFVHVGLPFTCDVETLDIDTVEQRPALLESKICEKVNVKVFNTRGLYVGSAFPENDYVDGMADLETRTEDIELGNVGNAAQPLQSKRIEVSVPNDWESNGRICFRQVDPLPFEILSIIPELNILR
jgi:hypothetical protein